jgi:predicted dienelactone hydrolase
MRILKQYRPVYGFSLALLTVTALDARAQLSELPRPTGPRIIGYREFHWVDSARAEIMTTSLDDRREISAFLWYPAARAVGERVPYFPDTAMVGPGYLRRYPTLTAIKQHAYANSPVAPSGAPFPVLLFSPGGGSSARTYQTIIEDLVSHGYVVLGVEAPYEGMPVRLESGRIAAIAELTFADPFTDSRNRADARALDLLFALRQLERLNGGSPGSDFRGQLDMARIGVFGHSRGGMAAAEACKREPRIRGCLNYDGAYLNGGVYSDTIAGLLTQPFMMMRKFRPEPTDSLLREWKMTPEQWASNRDTLEERARRVLRNQSAAPSYLVTIDGATHATFSDRPLIWTVAPVTADSIAKHERLLGIVRTYTRAFFDLTVRGVPAALLDRASPPYVIGTTPPPVQLEILSTRPR